LAHKQRRKHRKKVVLLNHMEALECIKAGEAVSSAPAEARI